MDSDPSDLDIYPLTPERWPDLELLFGPKGAVGGCWCMYWRLVGNAFDSGQGERNRNAFRKIVSDGEEPGLLGYSSGKPVGWVAIAPRNVYPKLARSRVLYPVDDQPVWSITCFFISRGFRRKGVSLALIQAAVAFARIKGAKIVEGYPVEMKDGKKTADAFAYTGLASAFRKAGFEEVARRSETRPFMRLKLIE